MLFISLVSSLIWKGKIKIKVCWERGTERAQSLDTDIARCTSCYLRIQESALKKLHMAAENAVITTQFNIAHLSLLSFLQHQPDVDLTSLPCDAPFWVGCHWLTRRLEMIHLMLLRPDLSSTKWFSSFGLNLDNDICFFLFCFFKRKIYVCENVLCSSFVFLWWPQPTAGHFFFQESFPLDNLSIEKNVCIYNSSSQITTTGALYYKVKVLQ